MLSMSTAISASILPIEDRPRSQICTVSQYSSCKTSFRSMNSNPLLTFDYSLAADLNIEKMITEGIRVNKREAWLAGLESGSQVR